MPTIGAVILAAGSSSRLGSPKQLLPYKGSTLLGSSISAVAESPCDPVILILGAKAEEVLASLGDQGQTVAAIVNEGWQEGIASSIRLGIETLIRQQPETEAVVIMACDQPYVTSQTINSLIASFRSSHRPIVASRYAGTLGIPALFNSSMFDELLGLSGDTGAKKLIVKHQDVISSIEFENGLFDIDTCDEYRALTGSDRIY